MRLIIRINPLVLIVFSLLAAGCQSVAPSLTQDMPGVGAQTTYPVAVETAECPFRLLGEKEEITYRCGIVRLPQDRSTPASSVQVGLFFAQLDALNPTTRTPPLLYLAGGPGASGVYDVPFLAPLLQPVRTGRDLLFFDIRGSGFSQPRIDCTLFTGGAPDTRCMEKLRAQGIEPMLFNTTQNAADAADLARVLGYSEVDLLAVSYGTRLALELLRAQPDIVRAAVLDSTVAPETLTFELQALGDYEARIWPFADCEAQPACRGRFGEMAGRFVALINRLDEGDPAHRAGAGPLDAGQLYRIADLAMNQPDAMALMPLLVDELDRGVDATYTALRDGEFWVAYAEQGRARYAFEELSMRLDASLHTLPAGDRSAAREGLAALAAETVDNRTLIEYLSKLLPASAVEKLRSLVASLTTYERGRLLQYYGADLHLYDHSRLDDIRSIINCQEEIPFIDPEAVRQNQAVIPVPSLLPPFDFVSSVSKEQQSCLGQGIQPAPAAFKDAVVSDTPVLLLSGSQDSVTPALWSRLAAASLTNARLVLFPAFGHALLYHDGDCVVEIVEGFLDDPLGAIDTACVKPVRYALEQPLLVPLTGRMWQLQGWAGTAADGLPATAFFSRGRVSGLGGCGPYEGVFALDGNRLRIDAINATDEQCSGAARALQDAFLGALASAQSILLRGDRLLLNTIDGDLLIFDRQSDVPLESPVWTLVAAAAPAGDGLVPALSGAEVTARFADGGISGALGCNLYEGNYSLVDGLAVRNVRPVSSVRCNDPPGIMEQELAVRLRLEAATSYRIVGRELFIWGEGPVPLLVFYADS